MEPRWMSDPRGLAEIEDRRAIAVLDAVIHRLTSHQPSLPFPNWVWDRKHHK